MPRSCSSSTKARNVRSGAAASRAISHSRCGANRNPGRPPIRLAAALPVARNRCDHFTTLATLTLNIFATARQLSPAATLATTRSRKSSE
jgi:hypothetical protein